MKTLHEVIGDYVVIAANERGWGMGKNIAEAKKKCFSATRKQPSRIGIAPKGTVIDGLCIEYPAKSSFSVAWL